MSATIVWRKISKKEPTLDVNGPSSFISECEKVFGKMPTRLELKDLPAIGVLIKISDGNTEAWSDLRELVEKHEEIELDARY